MKRWALLCLALAACSPPDAPESNGVAAENAAEPAPPAAPPPEMGAIGMADIEAELAPGSGCSLVYDGKDLLVAVDGDAIAKPNGTTLHFDFEGDLAALFAGGAFTAQGITITVTPAETEGQRIDELNIKPATATVERADGGRVRFEAEWQCGS